MDQKYTDPFDTLPAFEREIIRLRAYELTLTLYYKEEIERRVLDQIESHDRSKANSNPRFVPRSERGAKNRFRKSLDAMVSDGAISETERKEIVKAVDFRNDIGHRIDHLFSDLEQGRFAGGWLDPEIKKKLGIKVFDHQSIGRMRWIQKILDRTSRTNYRLGTFRYRGHLMFSSTEKVLLTEIRRSRKKLSMLANERKARVAQLNEELGIGFKLLEKLRSQSYFDLRFDLGKMTARGSEFCYMLFDKHLSDLAIAHIFWMRLKSIQARRRTWKKLGGAARDKPDWNAIPAITTPSRFDD